VARPRCWRHSCRRCADRPRLTTSVAPAAARLG
jgi:hypothetical protein